MAKFKVIKEFVLNGIVQKEGNIIDLDGQQQKLKSIKAFIEKVPDNTPVTGAPQGSVLGSLRPGETLTPEQKEKLAKENVAESVKAHEMAGEQIKNDIASGKAEPAVKIIAESLKDKLANNEFSGTPVQPTSNELPPTAGQ